MTEEELQQVESSARQWHETLRHQSDIAYYVEREEYNLFSLLKPSLTKDGDQWSCLYGENLQEGVCGFGDTPYKAILNFNKAWHTPLKA